MNENLRELIDDLLVKKAMYGLSAEEENQLSDLQRQAGVADESLSFELAAASVATGSMERTESLPAALRERILADAGTHFVKPSRIPVEETQPRVSIFGWLGWAFAAIALIALGLNIYFTRSTEIPIVKGPTPTPTPEKTVTPGDMRNALMASGRQLMQATIGAGTMKDVQPVGDVVWSDEMQKGYVRVTGLPKNDPQKETYQLWIVAENQNPKTPVDGGTFDVNAEGEVIIPINAKVKALNPQAFAITMEKPGGVPVSEQKKVAALAKRET